MTRTPIAFLRTRAYASTAVLVVAGALAGCPSNYHDQPGGLVQYDAGPGSPDGGIRPMRPVPTGEIAPVYGFVSPKAMVEYYYLGEVDRVGSSVPVNPIYFFYDQNDQPLFRLSSDGSRLVGWHPVVNVIPTRIGYSPFWRVVKVKVSGTSSKEVIDELAQLPTPVQTCQQDAVCPTNLRCVEERCRAPIKIGNFDLDAIKSLDTLNASKLAQTETDIILNCPVVDANAKLLKGLSNPDLPFPKIQIWYQRLKAFCVVMEGGKQLLGDGAGPLAGPEVAVAPAHFIRQQLSFGTETTALVLPARNLVLTEKLPGEAGYTPLVRELNAIVDKDHEFKKLRSTAEIAAAGLKVQSTDKLHNLVVRGTLPACTTDDDCANTGGKVDPPLKCSPESGYCSPPFARFGEECRRGVKECDPKGGPGGSRLACVGLLVRQKFFCFNACNSRDTDSNPDPEIDTRCGSAPRTRCFPLRGTDPTRPNGVCIRSCNSRAGGQKELIAECESASCGNGKLEFGETCDDGNTQDGDGCNRTCSLSTYERCDKNSDCRGAGQQCKEAVAGQGATYCLPAASKEKDEFVEDGKYRQTCMEFDYCWPPDVRADWLGKKQP